MKNKIFLTSIFAIAFACPAMAVDGNATIENGDTCNIDNLGTSENNSTANIEAIWTLQSINCPAGTSFNASTASCDTCASGSWCVAGTYDVENNQTGAGATLCSTLSNGDYPLSESGSSANTACYRNCANADVAHATQVSGAYYYGDNNQCSATECAAGWHLKEGFVFSSSNISTYNKTTSAWLSFDPLTFHEYAETGNNEKGNSYYGLSEDGATFAADFNNAGTVRGISKCSITKNAFDTQAENNISNEEGGYCWCKIIDRRPTETSFFEPVFAPWISDLFNYDNMTFQDCKDKCSRDCVYLFAAGGDQWRSVFFNTVQPSPASCEANNIGLDWYNDTVANNGTKITPNNDAANQCTYNETITVPTNEIQKPGYTFGGWKLRTNN